MTVLVIGVLVGCGSDSGDVALMDSQGVMDTVEDGGR